MNYDAILAQVLALLEQEQCLAYRVLKRSIHTDPRTSRTSENALVRITRKGGAFSRRTDANWLSS
jgi:hypothetical protein